MGFLKDLNEEIERFNDESIVCEKCGFKWITKSARLYVTCPNCQRKTKNNLE